MPGHIFIAFLILVSTVCFARASFITFFPPSASQCSNFTLSFTGNQISFPITLLLLPVKSSSPLVIQLPVTAFDSASNSGIYTTPIPFAAGTQFIAVMHDLNGLGNGGVSTVYTVGGSSDTDCLPDLGGSNTLAFRLSPSASTQCEIQTISWVPMNPNSDGDNLKNVNIIGYVVGGLAFRLNVGTERVSTSSSTMWQVSVPQGQEFMFFYERTDPATGTVQRETSAIQNIQPGANSTCTQGGPSVTPAAVPPSTSSGTATQTSASTLSSGLESLGDTPNNGIKLPKSALIGIIVGGVCFTVILGALIYLICSRKRRKPPSLEDDRQTTMSSESRAALMKINPTAHMGASLPPVRTSGFGFGSFSSPYRMTAVPAATLPAQGDRASSPDAARQRGRPFGRTKGRQKTVTSVGSWGNRGPLIESMIEPRLEPKSVPVGAMGAISEYSMPDPVPAPLPPIAIPMSISRVASGPANEQARIERYYPRGDSGTRSKSRDSENASAAAADSQASEYSPTELSHITPLYTPSAAGQTSIRNYYPAPVQPPSRANPLIQRRLSAYEEDEKYHGRGAGETRTGVLAFRPVPDGKSGVAL